MNVPGDSLAHWITLLIDGAATDAQRNELYAAVRRDPQARALYIEQMLLHAGLLFSVEGLAAPVATPRRRMVRVPGRVWRAAAAAVIVLAFIGIMSMLVTMGRTQRVHSAGQPIATLVDATHAHWGDGDLPTDVGAQLRGGTLRLQSGIAKIEFFSGAQVTLTGPAVFGLNSEMRGFLKSGKLVAYCPPTAHGFTVGAPGCAVVDLGTRFGMRVDATRATEVHVFQGRVKLVEGDADHPFEAGQAVRVSNGRIERVPEDLGAFGLAEAPKVEERLDTAWFSSPAPPQGAVTEGQDSTIRVRITQRWQVIARQIETREMQIGDTLALRFDVQWTVLPRAKSSTFRFGLCNILGGELTGQGYVVYYPLGKSGDAAILRRNGFLMAGSAPSDHSIPLGSNIDGFHDAAPHAVELRLQRVEAGMKISLSLDGRIIARDLDDTSNPAFFRFNQVCMSTGSAASQFTLRNVRVTYTPAPRAEKQPSP